MTWTNAMLVHITNRKPENQHIITITLNVSQFGVHKAASIALLNSPQRLLHSFLLSVPKVDTKSEKTAAEWNKTEGNDLNEF